MTEILKVLELADHDGMSQMKVWRCRVKSGLYPKRLAGRGGTFKQFSQFFHPNRLFRPFGEIRELFIKIHKSCQLAVLRNTHHLGSSAGALESSPAWLRLAPLQNKCHDNELSFPLKSMPQLPSLFRNTRRP